jgi:hypothetical protein
MSENLILESIYSNMCSVNEVVEKETIILEAMFDVDRVIVSSVDMVGFPRVLFRGRVLQEQSTDHRLVCSLINTDGGMMIIEDSVGQGDLSVNVTSGDNDVVTFKAIKGKYQVNDIDRELLIQKEEFVRPT